MHMRDTTLVLRWREVRATNRSVQSSRTIAPQHHGAAQFTSQTNLSKRPNFFRGSCGAVLAIYRRDDKRILSALTCRFLADALRRNGFYG